MIMNHAEYYEHIMDIDINDAEDKKKNDVLAPSLNIRGVYLHVLGDALGQNIDLFSRGFLDGYRY